MDSLLCRKTPKLRMRKFGVRGVACLAAALAWGSAYGQTAAPDWRHIGNSAIELALPSVGTGPVDRVWYSADGLTLFARTASGQLFETQDFEQWHAVADKSIAPPADVNPSTPSLPESAVKLRGTSDGRRPY